MRNRMTKTLMILLASVMILAGGAGTAFAATLVLGNNSENIINGGVLAADSSGTVYYANTQKKNQLYSRTSKKTQKLTGDAAANINVIGKNVYYTTKKNKGSVVYCYNLKKNKKSKCFATDQVIDEMYVDDEGVFYFLMKGSIYTRGAKDEENTLVLKSGKTTHFIPTAYGMIRSTGSRGKYHLYAGKTSIQSGVTSFYTVDKYLIFARSGKHYQVKIKDLFDGFSKSDIKKYSLGNGVDNVAGLAKSLKDEDCEVCDENAKEFKKTKKQTNDIDASTSGATSLLNSASVSDGQRNMVKRAKQQAQISWTPLSDVTGWGGNYRFSAGTAYQGIPYGQPVKCAYVPWDASLEEFAAAVADKSSKMYTSKSTYNKTAPYYSCDCSSFVSWAWDLPGRQWTNSIAGYAEKVETQSIYSVEIGDIFNLAGSHVVMVSDVGCNSAGEIVYIDIIEQTPPSPKVTRYGQGGSKTLADMDAKYLHRSGSDYILYRSKTRESVSYTPSSVVAIDGEKPVTPEKPKEPEPETPETPETPDPGEITMKNPSVTLAPGTSSSVDYDSTVSGTQSWSSSDKEVATVSKGTITAVAAGKATVTLSIGEVSASMNVYVKPGTVTLASLTPTKEGAVKLKWNAVSGASRYRVYRKNSEGKWEKIATVASPSYTDRNLANNTKYTYRVRAQITLDTKNYYGGYSKSASVKTVPATPTLKSLTAAGSTSQTITWDAVEGAAGYRVYGKKAGGKWKKFVTTTKTSYTWKSLKTGTKYVYTVRAYYLSGSEQVLSNYDAKGLTKTCCPLQPTLKSAASASVGQRLTVKWSRVSGIDGYRVYRKTKDSKWKKVADVKTTSYTDKSASYGTTYTYTVRAFKKVNGKAVLSSYDEKGVSGKAVLGTPKLKSAVSTRAKQLTVTWGAVQGAEGYRVYYKVPGGKWKKLTNTDAKTTSLTRKKLASGKTYIFTVRAFCLVNGKAKLSSYDKKGVQVVVK